MENKDYLKELSPELKSRVLASFVYASAGVAMWCFGSAQNFYYSTCTEEEGFLNLLRMNGTLDRLFSRKKGWEKPVMFSDELGVTWIAEHLYQEGVPSLLFLMGPFFLSETSLAVIENKLGQQEMPVFLKRQMMRLLGCLPVLYRPIVDQYINMLHFSLTAQPLGQKDIYYFGCMEKETTETELREQEIQQVIKETQSESHLQETVGTERARRGERMILQAVSEGNLNYKEVFQKDVVYGEDAFASKTGDSLRDAKNTVLVFNALCSRAAMDGGLPAKLCKQMEDRNMAEIERCTTITELTLRNSEILYEYVKKVHDSKENPLISKPTLECCEYIKANVYRPITVEDIAHAMGYTTYYFTKKFYREMGIRVTDYIKQKRIEYAKLDLLTSSKSIQEISDSLHFNTHNYFSRVFKEVTGMSPVEFRKKNGKV